MDGNLIWEKDFGDMRIRYQWGEGASPALADGHVIVTWDHTGRSFVAAFDVRTGRELWRTSRDDGTSWATPLVVEHNGRKQVVASAIRAVRSFDFTTGRELWRTRGMTPNPIPTPLERDGIVYLTGGYTESILLAVSLDKASGNARSAILWEYNRDTPYVPSPALYDGILYFIKYNTNMITALDARTGHVHYTRERLDGISGIYASPAAADGRIYFVGRNGVTVVVEHSAEFNVFATNVLPDKFDASPVIAGDEIFLRGHEWLWCVGE
jgi:outer membrane protein assembly factor BamB